MSKVFIIPDVHLKPWIFERADKHYSEGSYDTVVILGDLVDDWGQEKNKALYDQTFDAAIKFVKDHPNTYFCYGNHDISYVWEKEETGYSKSMRPTVLKRLQELEDIMGNAQFVHRIDRVVFSHAGIVEKFVDRIFPHTTPDIDDMINRINKMGPDELWQNDSPIWARPIYENATPYSGIEFQVVGHTPGYHRYLSSQILIADTFSTFSDGGPLGDEVFMWIDTITLETGEVNEGKSIKIHRSLR